MSGLTVRSVFAVLGFKVDDGPLRKFNRETDRAKGQLDQVDQGAKKARRSLFSLTDGVAKFGLVADGLAKLVSPLRDIVSTGARYESLKAALTTVEGGADKAAASFERLQKFAASTPFQLDELTQGFVKLKAQGLDTSDRALKAWGDTAASMSKTYDQMVEAVSDASRGEFERLKEFGIVASKQGDQVEFLFKGMKTTVARESGAIQKYLMELSESNFAGGMERQSETLSGLWSTLKDNAAAAADELFRAGLGEILKEWVAEGIQAAKATAEWIKKNKELIRGRLKEWLGNIRSTAKTLWPIIKGLAEAVLFLVDGISKIGVGVGPALVGLAALRTAVIAATGPWGLLAAAAIAAGLAIANAMADAEKRTESLGRSAARAAKKSRYKGAFEGKSVGELHAMKGEIEAERRAGRTIREDVRGMSPAKIKRLERERQLDEAARQEREAMLDEAISKRRDEVLTKQADHEKELQKKNQEYEDGIDAESQKISDKEELRALRKRAKKRGGLTDAEVDRKKELEKGVGAYVPKGSTKKPKKQKSLLDLVTNSKAGGGEAAIAGRGLGTTIINLDARSDIKVSVVAPEGLAGSTSTQAQAVAMNTGTDIGTALEPYLQRQTESIRRVFEG